MVTLQTQQYLFIEEKLNENIRKELAWGSHLILTATPAATLLVYWGNETILKRGLIRENRFHPGDICLRAKNTSKMISLVNTRMYPGRKEFDSILPNLPSVIIYSISNNGWVIVGGWSERCFSKSDEKWISGWSDKLFDLLNT